MRHRADTRMILVKKKDLINKIKENKKQHIIDFEEAKVLYQKEAIKQLAKLTKRAKKGEGNLKLDLTTPVNKSDEYDKLIVQFEMEVKDEVELSQGEFNEYIHDETQFAIAAKLSNTFYK